MDSVVENLERCSNFLRTEFLKHFIGRAAGRGLRGGNAAHPQNRRNFKNVRGFFGDDVFCRIRFGECTADYERKRQYM